MLDFILSAFLAEIKEISEKDQNEEEKVFSIGAGYRQPIRPHMKFEYPDPDIQEDLYQLMKYACGEVCTPEQRDKVMKIWTTFIEPVLGVPSHPSEGDIEKVNNHAAKTLANNGERNANSVASDRKLSDMSKTGGENISTEQSCSGRMLVTNKVNNDGYPDAGNSTSEIDKLCNATQNGTNDTNMMPVSKQASPPGPGGTNGDRGIKAVPSNKPQVHYRRWICFLLEIFCYISIYCQSCTEVCTTKQR